MFVCGSPFLVVASALAVTISRKKLDKKVKLEDQEVECDLCSLQRYLHEVKRRHFLYVYMWLYNLFMFIEILFFFPGINKLLQKEIIS